MIACSSNVWFRDGDGAWGRGCVSDMEDLPVSKSNKVAKTKFILELQNETGDALGEMVEMVSQLEDGSFEEFETVKLRNPMDDDHEAARDVEDLITLNHLHEPAILTCLKGRFDANLIYTSTGPILIAVVMFITFCVFFC